VLELRLSPFIPTSSPLDARKSLKEEIPKAPPHSPRNLLNGMPQDFFCFLYFLRGWFWMTALNAYAAARMPSGLPLPDLLHKACPVASTLRIKSFDVLQLSNISCLLNGGILTLSWLLRRDNLNIRRLVFISTTFLILRSFAFTLTSLPAPCAGLAHCPCADPETLHLLATTPPLKVVLIWMFGAGIFLKYPQCGELIISGHTTSLWASFRSLADFLNRTFDQPFSRLGIFLNGAVVATFLGYIVISRNHSGVNVFFGWLLPEAIWQTYQLAKNAA
jgi:hypothetical protein